MKTIPIILTMTLGLLLACGAKARRLGEAPPSGIATVTMAELLQKPEAFRDRPVLVEGRIGSLGCADCGGVLLTDKTWRLSVEPEDPKAFRIPVEQGARLRAWGRLHVESESGKTFVELKAKGVELP